MCENLGKIAVCALILQKCHPKARCRRFFFVFFKLSFYLLLFGQVWKKLGKCGENLGTNGAWKAL